MNKGFTLIEITIVMAIMGILMGCSVLSFKYYNDIQNKMLVDYNCNEVISFINNSKMYCKENSCSAVITFDKIRGKILLDRGLNTMAINLTEPLNVNSIDFN
ncbi:MAG: pilus assembly FimT family protein [Clostridium sp.]|uniref:pilus assembly FimT family protein n=1 Tax=Clostridium sp. TaxID=1506 RepID=UPI003D6CB410